MQQLSRPPAPPPDTKYLLWLFLVLITTTVVDIFLRVYQVVHK